MLQSVVEIDILERLLHLVAQTVANGVNVISFVERECLDKMVVQSVRAVVRAVRIVQRWHTGKLRYNLLWLPAALLLATFLLIIMGG